VGQGAYFTITAERMAEKQEASSTRRGRKPKLTRTYCVGCWTEFKTDGEIPCPACGHRAVLPKPESLGYRVLIWILWVDVAITIGTVVLVAGSCG
jgi:DNA-directed RNA polymerase subunit RPC12/RpoP